MIHESPDGGKTYTSRPMRDNLSHNSSNNSEAKLSNNMTSIDYLFNELWEAPKDKFTWHSILNKAKEMHKQEMATNCSQQETLYTEEQLRKAYEYGNNYHKGSIADAQEYTFEKLIQSLKQPKKD